MNENAKLLCLRHRFLQVGLFLILLHARSLLVSCCSLQNFLLRHGQRITGTFRALCPNQARKTAKSIITVLGAERCSPGPNSLHNHFTFSPFKMASFTLIQHLIAMATCSLLHTCQDGVLFSLFSFRWPITNFRIRPDHIFTFGRTTFFPLHRPSIPILPKFHFT